MLLPKQEIIRGKKHLAFIRSLPCCVTGKTGGTQAAHIRYETNGGTALKPGDDWTVPLFWESHNEQHKIGEVAFWERCGGIEKAKKLARLLYKHTGDHEKAIQLIARFINGDI